MKNKNSGFNILEIVVVFGLMGILLTVALPNFSKNKTKSRDNVRIADMQTIRTLLEQYRATCGVFPNTLESSANNGRSGTCRVNLGSFGVIPKAPNLSNTSPYYSSGSLIEGSGIVNSSSVYNGYFYAGLSSRSNGPCFDYHLGVELEFSTDNNFDSSGYLDKDHDFEDAGDDPADPFPYTCLGSSFDFDGTEDAIGLYDFRSTKSE